MISEKTLINIANFLPSWGKHEFDNTFGVNAVCIAGGGEPLVNPATGKFIEQLASNGIEIGIATNGSLIHNFMDPLLECNYVAVSVDSGSPKTFDKLKHLKEEDRQFENVIHNMADLIDYAAKKGKKLGTKNPYYGVNYRYLLYKDNIGEIYQAAKLAKQIGCKNIQFRPAGTPWTRIGTKDEIIFSDDDIALFNEEMRRAFELDDESFGVYGTTSKFNAKFGIDNSFCSCHSIFMTGVFMPANVGNNTDHFTFALCCDRRGDQRMELVRDETNVEVINQKWGSEEHWRIHDDISIKEQCPRCSYQPHNQIYEQVIKNDNMLINFI